jgi:hypothetical protein
MAGRGLERAIESVIGQTCDDWELLIVDDGSTDGSGMVGDWYASRDPRIRVHHQPNRGLACARNAGYWLGRGEFVAHLDGDDEWVPEKLDRQLAALIARPDCGASIGRRRLGTDEGWNWPTEPTDGWDAVYPENNAPCQSVVLRRSLLQLVGGNRPEAPFTNSAQDWEQWVRAFAVTQVDLQRELTYIQHNDGQTLSRTNQRSEAEHVARRLTREWATELGERRRRMAERPIRVLMVGLDAYSRGAQTVTQMLLGHLDPAEFEARVLLLSPNGELMDWYRERCTMVRADRDLLDSLRWADVVHLQWHGWTVPRLIRERAQRKLVVTEHSMQLRWKDEAAARATVWLTQRPQAGGDLPNAFAPGMMEIQNAAWWPEAARQSDALLIRSPFVLGLVPLQAYKGCDTWLEAAKLIHQEMSDVSFVLCGVRSQIDREYKPVMAEIQRLRARGARVHVLPPQPRSVVRDLCERAALVMHLSRTEAQPLAVIEAQSCGTPVVVTAVGGAPQLVHHGAVIAVEQPSAAARAALRLIGSRMDTSTQERVLWRHDPRRVSGSWAEVYRWTRLQGLS